MCLKRLVDLNGRILELLNQFRARRSAYSSGPRACPKIAAMVSPDSCDDPRGPASHDTLLDQKRNIDGLPRSAIGERIETSLTCRPLFLGRFCPLLSESRSGRFGGRWTIVFFFFAAAAAFLILFLAAAFCAVVILQVRLRPTHRAFEFW